MILENQRLYNELKEIYPDFFLDGIKCIIPARANGKTLLRTFMYMAISYTQWFVHKLQCASKPLTRKEYEDGLITIKNLLYN